jgi:hypothetical protein
MWRKEMFSNAFVFLTLLFIGLQAIGCRAPNDNSILADRRVSDCVLSTTRGKLNKEKWETVCGKYRDSDGSVNGLDLTFDSDTGFLTEIVATDGRYTTPNGLHVGSGESEIKARLGPGVPVAYAYQTGIRKETISIQHSVALRYPGVLFVMGDAGYVIGVVIAHEKQLDSITCALDKSTNRLMTSSRPECQQW